MASNKLIFLVSFLLVALVWGDSERFKCKSNDDCIRIGIICPLDYSTTFCFEGLCYCKPYIRNCEGHDVADCPSCAAPRKKFCVDGLCLCKHDPPPPPRH